MRLLLIGGGHAHVEVLRRLGEARVPGLEAVLASPDAETAYSGRYPGLFAGHYGPSDSYIPLPPLARRAGATFLEMPVCALDAAARRATLSDGREIGFDIASLDIGGSVDRGTIPGAGTHAIGVKPLGAFRAAWRAAEEGLPRREGRLRLVVVGGGGGGAELILALHYRLVMLAAMLRLPESGLSATLVQAGPELVPDHAPAVRRRLAAALARHGIATETGRAAARVEENRLSLADGGSLPFDVCVMATGVAPASWLRESGLALNERGFVKVDRYLRAPGHPHLFAAGDVAAFMPRPIAHSGVHAVRQGPVLAHNLRAAATNGRLRPFRPRRHTLALISLGGRRAVMSWGPFAAEGRWAWRWKDRLDGDFIRRYRV